MAIRTEPAGDRVWTIPNLLSVIRLVGVPFFLWLVLVPQADWWALGVLAFAGISDWLDGKIARAWNQASRLGAMLDPMADRLYIFAALLGLVVRGIIPWWLMAILVARDILIVVALPVLRHFGYGPLPVNLAGKTATLCLLYSFPLLFVAGTSLWVGDVARVLGWAFAIWGTALYWWAGLLYAVQGRRLIGAARRAALPDGTSARRVDLPPGTRPARPTSTGGGDPGPGTGSTTARGPEDGRRDDSGPPHSDRKGATSAQ